ncbi:MAG: hypothetical protein SNI45_03515 [Rikenellaceae bacterium]
MKIPITREIKIKLLKWLKNGCIDTLDIPEIQTTGAQEFLALMQSASIADDDEVADEPLTPR